MKSQNQLKPVKSFPIRVGAWEAKKSFFFNFLRRDSSWEFDIQSCSKASSIFLESSLKSFTILLINLNAKLKAFALRIMKLSGCQPFLVIRASNLDTERCCRGWRHRPSSARYNKNINVAATSLTRVSCREARSQLPPFVRLQLIYEWLSSLSSLSLSTKNAIKLW